MPIDESAAYFLIDFVLYFSIHFAASFPIDSAESFQTFSSPGICQLIPPNLSEPFLMIRSQFVLPDVNKSLSRLGPSSQHLSRYRFVQLVCWQFLRRHSPFEKRSNNKTCFAKRLKPLTYRHSQFATRLKHLSCRRSRFAKRWRPLTCRHTQFGKRQTPGCCRLDIDCIHEIRQ